MAKKPEKKPPGGARQGGQSAASAGGARTSRAPSPKQVARQELDQAWAQLQRSRTLPATKAAHRAVDRARQVFRGLGG